MTERHIDFNRGNDSNPGTVELPWKNLSKITSEVRTAGDEILLADDSEFEITARILLNSGLGWSSSGASPIRFGVYSPLSVTGGRPIIRKRVNIAAGSWTYSAPNNAWTYTASNTISSFAFVKCGGDWATRTDNALPLDSVDGRWSNSGSTLYVYAPSGTNPTDYYGSVTFGGDSSDAAFVVSSPGSVAAFTFSGWRFEETGTGIYVFNSTGTRTYRISDMEGDETGCLFYLLTQTAGAVDYEIDHVVAANGGTALIGGYAQGGVGVSRWVVRDCDLADCNFGFPQGAVYTQIPSGEITRVRVARARYGVPGKSSDGAGIYTETGSDNTVISECRISDCYLAFQDNSGKSTTIRSSIVEDCYAICKITDAQSHQDVNFTFEANTCLGVGAPVAPVAGSVAGIGVLAYTVTSPAMNFSLRDNVLVAHSQAPSAYAFELPSNATGTISHCDLSGFAGIAEIYGGGTTPITPTNCVLVAPGARWDYMPTHADVRSSGTYIAGTDYYGVPFENPPTMGAVQYKAALAEPALPALLYDNRLEDGTPAASTTETEFDVLNLRDLRPYSFWKPTALPATITVDCGATAAADFAAIYRHDLASRDCFVEIRGSTDNFSSSDVLLIRRRPTTDESLILPFDPVEYRYWRIVVDGLEIPTLAIALIGEALRLPRRFPLGFDITRRDPQAATNISAGGYPLGRVISYEEWRQRLEQDRVTWSWIRETWIPAWKAHLRSEPFLLAWDSTDHPTEVQLAIAAGGYETPTLFGEYCGLTLDLQGVAS